MYLCILSATIDNEKKRVHKTKTTYSASCMASGKGYYTQKYPTPLKAWDYLIGRLYNNHDRQQVNRAYKTTSFFDN